MSSIQKNNSIFALVSNLTFMFRLSMFSHFYILNLIVLVLYGVQSSFSSTYFFLPNDLYEIFNHFPKIEIFVVPSNDLMSKLGFQNKGRQYVRQLMFQYVNMIRADLI